MKLNLGCGELQMHGYVNVDWYEDSGIDLVMNLDEHPWPWADDSCDEVVAFDIYEHVDKPLEFMNECWRVLEPGGLLKIRTSHWKGENSFTDPTHKRFLTERSWDYWIPGRGYHKKYGKGYADGRHFTAQRIVVTGSEICVELVKTDRCNGAC